jgi:hypothetical protein
MSPKSGSSFGSFGKTEKFQPNIVIPITTEFSKGSVPGSIATVNRESAWARWRRGYELATANTYDNDYSYRFSYQLPVPEGTPSSETNPNPVVSGCVCWLSNDQPRAWHALVHMEICGFHKN